MYIQVVVIARQNGEDAEVRSIQITIGLPCYNPLSRESLPSLLTTLSRITFPS